MPVLSAEGGSGGVGLTGGGGGRGGAIEVGSANGPVSTSGQFLADGGGTALTNNVAGGGGGGAITIESDATFLGAAPFETPPDGVGGAVVNTAIISVNGGASAGAIGGTGGAVRIESDAHRASGPARARRTRRRSRQWAALRARPGSAAAAGRSGSRAARRAPA